MPLFLTPNDISKLVKKISLNSFMLKLVSQMEADYKNWSRGRHGPRHATHYPHGVMEVMPYADDEHYGFKFVNGHPYNPKDNKLTVGAFGALFEIKNGYPLIISEMTILTAIRTAATSAMMSKYMAKPSSDVMAVIGCGAQSEFQIIAHQAVLGLKTIRYYDTDQGAMDKMGNNLKTEGLSLVPCSSIKEAIQGVDIITTLTAAKERVQILAKDDVVPGVHINAVGGDCPGKTELDDAILQEARVVVEFRPQAQIEGEIQKHHDSVDAEVFEVIQGSQKGRDNEHEITLFDSVGYALEDFSTLKLVYDLANEHHIGEQVVVNPDLENPKDLYGFMRQQGE